MLKKLLLLSAILLSFNMFSQDILHCGTDEMRIATLETMPDVAKAVIEREKSLENFTHKFISEKAAKDISADTALYIIPVVFHIIHNYGIENISNEQAYSGIDILNQTFRKQRPDTGDIVSVFKPLHADTRIEFRLAKKDPDGNCHSGINRIASNLSETGGHNVKTLIHWDPAKYLNIYIVKNAAGLAGHCIFPSDADTIPGWDGIVISHNYVGTIGTSNLVQSVALAHECGHYLNLQHIWGGNNVPGYYFLPCADPLHDCNIDDGVADTPPTIGWQSCNLSGASCSNPVDMVQNVMDYSYCNIMFTAGQRDRMQAALNSPIGQRNNLWQPANLVATGVYDEPIFCGVDFGSNKKAVCPGGTVTFNNQSFQPPFDEILWTFQGGSPSSSAAEAPQVTYSTAGVYPVSLKVIKGSDTLVETKADYISVLPSSGATLFPFQESFETTSSLNGQAWFENSFDGSNRWQLTSSAAYSGSKSVMLANFNNTMDTKDELYAPLIDLTTASEVNIVFKYAFALKTGQTDDELLVQINKTCSNFWLTKLTLSATELETAAPQSNAFTPASQQEWKQGVVTVPSSYFTDDFRFRFVFSARGGNNVFIDDINIDVAAGIEETLSDKTMLVYPNPAKTNLNIILPKNAGRVNECILLDAKGCIAATYNTADHIDISMLNSGLYFVLVYTDSVIYRQRVIKE